MKYHTLILAYGLLLLANFSTVEAAGWSEWVKYSNNPVYTHSGNAASDPSIIKDGDTYRMVVSGNGGNNPDGNSLIMATSPDGVSWSTLANGNNGIVVPSEKKVWDLSLEMPELVKWKDSYLIFYSGYDPAVAEASGGTLWGDLGRAVSKDGVLFTRTKSGAVLQRTANWYDQDGITDATVIEEGGTLYMVYVGWCIRTCTQNNNLPAFYALKATSVDGGLTWTKLGLLDPQSAKGTTEAYQMIGLQHPDLVKEADGKYAIYYGVDEACRGGKIGLYKAVSDKPFGSYTVQPSPIFCLGNQDFETKGTDGGFPAVVNDNGRGRIYYTGVEESTYTYKVGLIQTPEVKNQPVVTPPVVVIPKPSTDTTAAKISRLRKRVGQDTFSITWRTNESTDATIMYGTTKDFSLQQTRSTLAKAHSFTLTALSSNTIYYYTVVSKDAAGNVATSKISSFKTKAVKKTKK